jgi:tetratricopeptide (TPR) repeat protein
MTDRELDDWRTQLIADMAKLQERRAEREEKGAPAEELALIDNLGARILSQLQQLPAVRLQRQFVRLMATYFLAHIAYERGNYSDAAEYFRFLHETEGPAMIRIVEALPSRAANDAEIGTRQIVENVMKPLLTTWTTAANYNLARSLEAAGRYPEAIEAYKADTSPDQRPGSLYRAKRLEAELAGKTKAAESKKAVDEKKTPDAKKAPDATAGDRKSGDAKGTDAKSPNTP